MGEEAVGGVGGVHHNVTGPADAAVESFVGVMISFWIGMLFTCYCFMDQE